MLSRTLLFLLVFCFFACSNDAAFSKDYSPGTESSLSMEGNFAEEQSSKKLEQPSASPQGDDAQEQTPLILLRQAHCRLEIENMTHELNRIQFLVNEHQGYVSDLNIQNNNWRKEATFLLRVPAKHFQATLDSLKNHAKKVDYQRISTQDVTEEYVDISSRLETKKQVRDRYIDILRNKAKTVEEILMAEEKIRHLQEEIEAREGRLRYLKDRASMSTITVELYQELEPQDEEEEESWISRFFSDAGDSLGFGGELVRGIVLGLMAMWPLLIILGLIIWRRKAIKAKLFGRKK
jgi:hypothetical protein